MAESGHIIAHFLQPIHLSPWNSTKWYPILLKRFDTLKDFCEHISTQSPHPLHLFFKIFILNLLPMRIFPSKFSKNPSSMVQEAEKLLLQVEFLCSPFL